MTNKISTTTDVGRWNAETVLQHLYSRDHYTNAELTRAVGLSRTAVERALDLLVERGLVTKSEPVALASGRPAATYGLRPEFGYLLAIDVGAHTVRARVDDLAGPGSDQSRPRPAGPSPNHGEPERTTCPGHGWEPEPLEVGPKDPTESRLNAMERLADRALAEAGVAREQVRAVTIGTPGVVDAEGTIKNSWVIRAAGWEGDLLRRWASERFAAAAVAVDNDANLAVLAEQRFGTSAASAAANTAGATGTATPGPATHRAAGAAPPGAAGATTPGAATDMVVVFAGRRIGFGIVHGGGLHRGAHGQAGEAANVTDSPWGRASRWLHAHEDDAPALFALAADGFPAAHAAVEELADLLGMAFAEVVQTIDPELIVLGGALALAGETILGPVTERFERACRGMETPDLRLSRLGRRAVLLGAAELARRRAFAHLLDTGRQR